MTRSFFNEPSPIHLKNPTGQNAVLFNQIWSPAFTLLCVNVHFWELKQQVLRIIVVAVTNFDYKVMGGNLSSNNCGPTLPAIPLRLPRGCYVIAFQFTQPIAVSLSQSRTMSLCLFTTQPVDNWLYSSRIQIWKWVKEFHICEVLTGHRM